MDRLSALLAVAEALGLSALPGPVVVILSSLSGLAWLEVDLAAASRCGDPVAIPVIVVTVG